MAWKFGDIGSGAAGGAMAGAALGPWGAVGGALLGGVFGGMNQGMPSAQSIGLTPIDVAAKAKEFASSPEELATNRNLASANTNNQIDGYARQLISSGIDPNQAYSIAQDKYKSAMGQFETSQNQALSQERKSIAQSLIPAQMQRDEDILNYNLQRNSQPGVFQSMLPAIGGMWMGQAQGPDGLKNNWIAKLFK